MTIAPAPPAPRHLVELTRQLLELLDDDNPADTIPRLVKDLNDYRILAYSEGRRIGIPAGRDVLGQQEALTDILDSASTAFLDPEGVAFRSIALVGIDSILPSVLPPGWEHAGPRLVEHALKVRQDELRPVSRIRWANAPTGRRPDGDVVQAETTAQRLPVSLWAGWSLRLLPLEPIRSHAFFREVTAVALLLPRSGLPVAQLCEILTGDGTQEQDVTRCLRELSRISNGSDTLKAIAQLSDALKSTPSPIDYARRRRLPIGDELLSSDRWKEYCGRAGVARGVHWKIVWARLWLWETLTGGARWQAPHELRVLPSDIAMVNHGEYFLGATYDNFLRHLTPELRDALSTHAIEVLHAHGITDEPLEWEPRSDSVELDRWPGLDVGDVDMVDLRDRLLSDESLGSIAEQIGCTFEHIRLLLRYGRLDLDRTRYKGVEKYIPETDLRRAIVEEGMSARAAAEEFGVNCKTISAHCRKAAIPLARPGRPRTWDVDST